MTDSAVGQTVGNYRLEELLGTGGMGRVYRGKHIHLGRMVAVKLMHANFASDPGFQARFLQEAQSAAALNHANIVGIQDFGQQEGRFYLVMELLADGSVRSLLQERASGGQPWPVAIGLDLVRQSATGLAYAHSRGMVHRDIKPDNLLIQRLGTAGTPEHAYVVKVGDFGLARIAEGGVMTANGVTLGTPAYMSPEQCQGIELDGRSDIYSLGIVLYEVVTGYLPFETKSLSDAVYKHVYTAPPSPRQVRPDLPQALEEIILRCLEKQPAARYATATDLVEALTGIDGGVKAQPVAWPAPPPPAVSPVSVPPPPPFAAVPPPPPVLLPPPPPPFAVAPYTPNGTIMQPLVGVAQPPPLADDGARVNVPVVQVLDASGHVRRSIPLQGSWLTLGRGDDNDIVLNDGAISRHHLRIDWDGQHATVTDLGSSNGTVLGEQRLLPQTTREWDAEKLVGAGPFWLRLALPAAPPPPPPLANVAAPEVDGGRLRVVLEGDTLTLTLGQPAVLRLTLGNLGSTVDHLRLTVEGVPAAWVRVPPQEVQLNPGNQAPVALNIIVPRAVESYAGVYPITIRARSRENPAESGSAQALWTVLPFISDSLTLAPSRASGRTTAAYTATMQNEGNAGTRYTLRGEDKEGKLRYRFAQPVVELDPGGSAAVVATVSAPRRWIGTATVRPFTVYADEVGGAASQNVAGEFVHGALIPVWVPPLALAALALLAFLVISLLGRNPKALSVNVTPQDRIVGEQVTVNWTVSNAKQVEVKLDGTTVETEKKETGSYSFVPDHDGPVRIEVIARNNAGSLPSDQMITIRKADADEPLIEQFDVCAVGTPAGAACPDPLVITLGEQVVVRWRVKNPQQVSLSILGTLEGADKTAGERTDLPGQSGQISYVLTANDPGGATKTRTRRVNVNVPPTAVPTSTAVPPPTAVPPIVGNGPGNGNGDGGGAAQTMTVSAANAAGSMAATATASAAAGQLAATGTANAAATMTTTAAKQTSTVTVTPTPSAATIWQLSAAPMSVARTGQTTTLLKDGKVLVTGGVGSSPSTTALNSVELYDPATKTWKVVAPMSIGRTEHTATLLDNGAVLVVGGFNNGDPKREVTALNTAELYDPAKDIWSAVGSLPGAHAFHTATLLKDGGVLIVGGASGSGGGGSTSVLKTSALYNPVTKTWLPAGTTAVGHLGHTATLLPDGTVLVVGAASDPGSPGNAANSTELFTTVPKPTWTVTGALTTARVDHAAVLLQDGTVMVIGGRGGVGTNGAVIGGSEIFITATKRWAKGPDLGTARTGLTATLLADGSVLAVGGKSGGASGAPLNSSELLPRGGNAWRPGGVLMVTRTGHTATLLTDGQILVVGGATDPRTEFGRLRE